MMVFFETKSSLAFSLITFMIGAGRVASQCCPPGFIGVRPFAQCKMFYGCFDGLVTSLPSPCGFGLRFDATQQTCRLKEKVTSCTEDICPLTSEQRDHSEQNIDIAGNDMEVPAIEKETSQHELDRICCPDPSFTGFRALNDCSRYYSCVRGKPSGVAIPCGVGLKFDETAQHCTFASMLTTTCMVDPCTDSRMYATPVAWRDAMDDSYGESPHRSMGNAAPGYPSQSTSFVSSLFPRHQQSSQDQTIASSGGKTWHVPFTFLATVVMNVSLLLQ